MAKKIIKIDAEKCIGCWLCAETCQQSAIEMVDGKAKVVRDDYCDGLGNCLPVCPVEAISFVEPSPTEINTAVKSLNPAAQCPGVCVGSVTSGDKLLSVSKPQLKSELRQWPAQLKLVPTNAPYFNQAHLLIAADCAAYAYANFHQEFMKDKITLIGCPKLDAVDYSQKLIEIIAENNLESVTVARMEVPCCGGLERAALEAYQASRKAIPWNVATISIDGKILL